MKNKIADLRDHLFTTLEALVDPDPEKPPMDLAKAKTIAEVAQTIINSAKVEVDFLRAADAIGALRAGGGIVGAGFFESPKQLPGPENGNETTKRLTK